MRCPDCKEVFLVSGITARTLAGSGFGGVWCRLGVLLPGVAVPFVVIADLKKIKAPLLTATTNVSVNKRIKSLIEHLKSFPVQDVEALMGKLKGLLHPDLLTQEKKRAMLDWEEIREMGSDGIGFGSHTSPEIRNQRGHGLCASVKGMD